jgi:hypothetical protein
MNEMSEEHMCVQHRHSTRSFHFGGTKIDKIQFLLLQNFIEIARKSRSNEEECE